MKEQISLFYGVYKISGGLTMGPLSIIVLIVSGICLPYLIHQQINNTHQPPN
jgi:hypothetical protein